MQTVTKTHVRQIIWLKLDFVTFIREIISFFKQPGNNKGGGRTWGDKLGHSTPDCQKLCVEASIVCKRQIDVCERIVNLGVRSQKA